jgi:hypothetical protein
MSLIWSNPRSVDLRKRSGFLYFARILDPDTGREHRYVGRTTRGESRLREYRRNVERIFSGLPRRITPGQELYRAVHLAMAKGCQHGWEYEFYPLENAPVSDLLALEQLRIAQLGCDLNTGRLWAVADYARLSIMDLCKTGESA